MHYFITLKILECKMNYENLNTLLIIQKYLYYRFSFKTNFKIYFQQNSDFIRKSNRNRIIDWSWMYICIIFTSKFHKIFFFQWKNSQNSGTQKWRFVNSKSSRFFVKVKEKKFKIVLENTVDMFITFNFWLFFLIR